MARQTVMDTLGGLQQQFTRKLKRYHTRTTRLDTEITRLTKQRKQTRHPSWIDTLVKPIAEAAVATMPGWSYEILGPFGLCAAVSIHFTKNGVDWRKPTQKGALRSITFVLGDFEQGELQVRDYTQDSGRYPKGTIGELNGMNQLDLPIPPEATIAWFLKWIL